MRIEPPGYDIVELIQVGSTTLVCRAVRRSDGRPVVLKTPKRHLITPAIVERYQREYELLHDVRGPGILEALSLESVHGAPMLVLEDFGARSLAVHGLERRLPLRTILVIATRLVEILAEVHDRGIIHGDLNPSNILLDPDTDELKLADFGWSIRRDEQAGKERYGGTLAYMSPEHTGRLDRQVDHRTDLYSLGVTLYELCANELPFPQRDALELVHSHVAREAIPLHERAEAIPVAISDIVDKLMAKMPEDRYQSARGCRADLDECLRQLERSGTIERFVLGREDHREQLQIPARLYGRTAERQLMRAALERVVAGRRQLLLVAGPPGTGKTALVAELGDLVALDQGYFLRGKYDQYRRSTPYSALAQAFGGLMHTLATKAEGELERWRQRLGEAMGENAGVLVEVVPELAFVVGPQPPVASLGPVEAENRFHYVFRRFVEVLCRDQPLVVLLDNLQWADHASLRLVKLMLTDPVGGHLLIIGAYRDDEVDPAHPLSSMVEQLHREGHEIPSFQLGPLQPEHVEELVAETLRRPPAECARLTAEVMAKTGGNPFFVRHCLLALHHDGLLRFDPPSGGWSWDLGALDALGLADTVVDLMLIRLRQLPEDTQRILPMAACMGGTFELVTLGILVEEDPGTVARRLAPALDMGLLSQRAREPLRGGPEASATATYAFSHERVQQAAYALIPQQDRAALHLEMARLLTRALSPDERAQRVFELVEHYTVGAALVEDVDERLSAARLCLTAGLRAKESMAYEDAARFLRQGRSLMPEGGWREHYPLMRHLAMATMQAEYLSGHAAAAQPLAAEILRSTQDVFDEIEVCKFQIEFHLSRQQVSEALEVGLEVLSRLGVDLPREVDAQKARVEQLRSQLQIDRLDVARLEHLPDLSDPLRAGIMRILLVLFTPAYYIAPELSQLILLTQLEICLREGHCHSAPPVYISVAAMLCMDNENLDVAHRLGTFALRLLERFPDPSTKVRTELQYHSFILPWNRPRSEALEWLGSLTHRGLASGDVEFACVAAMACASIRFQSGAPLEAVRKEELGALALVERYSTSMALQMLVSEERTVCALLGEPVGRVNAPPVLPMAIVRENLAQATLHYIMGDIDAAFEAMQRTEPYGNAAAGLPISIEEHYWYPLIALDVLSRRSERVDAAEQLARVERKRANLHEWAGRVPETFAAKRALVDAEYARVRDEPLGTIMSLYDEAIECAQRYGNAREEAVSCERAADFYAALGRQPIADMYRSEAYLAYRCWGARAKVDALEAQYPWLTHRFGGIHARDTSSSGDGHRRLQASGSSDRFGADASRLDFEAVVRASQALSSQLVLDQLLAELMKIIIENAGAQRGYLLLGEGGPGAAPLTLEAEGNADVGRYRALPSLPLHHPDVGLARTVVSYVSHTRDSLVLRDAKREDPYAHDPYVRAAALRSVMCTPVEHQGKFIGVVYLENNLTTNAFTPTRAQVVRMLATQAAISIENARLLGSLESSKQEAERANRAKSTFLASVNHELRTPMNGIIGAIELLKGMEATPEQTGYLDIARTSAEQLLSIIRDTLDVSQIEAGRLVLEPIRFSLDECSASLRRILSMQLESGSITFSLGVEEDVPRDLIGDRDRLMQILINLLGNAIKFTSADGQVALRVAVSSRTEGSLLLRFEVRDTGIGIAPRDLQRIFDPFTRVHEPGLGKKGTGLGLAIAARVVEMMSGTIGVESEVGKGSLFWFTARFECAEPERPAPAPAPAPEPERAQGLRILIAEDNRINQIVAQRMLEREGHRCTVVNDGAEALSALDSNDVDVVFMDVHMPVMDGPAASREIRRREVGTGRHVPIVAFTASATTDVVRDCSESGMDHFLSKPLVRSVVHELLHDLASRIRR
jgi:predicted ATPase/signal transduction histidine kinase/ActR/RegA family two-component response regulator